MWGVFAACNASVVPMTVFSCDTGGKTVSVTSDNNSLTYSYGATGRIEKSITGDARSGNLHWMQMRYAGLVSQPVPYIHLRVHETLLVFVRRPLP